MAASVAAVRSAGGPAGTAASRSAAVAWSRVSGVGWWFSSFTAAPPVRVHSAGKGRTREFVPQGGSRPAQQHADVIRGDPKLGGDLGVAPAFQGREAENFCLPRVDPGEGLPQSAGEFLPCRSIERVSGVVVGQWRFGERPGPRRPAVAFTQTVPGRGWWPHGGAAAGQSRTLAGGLVSRVDTNARWKQSAASASLPSNRYATRHTSGPCSRTTAFQSVMASVPWGANRTHC